MAEQNINPERSRRENLTSRLWRGSPVAADRLTSFLFYLAILFFIIGFNFSDNRAGGWTQQFMPNLGGAQIRDITFNDSLTGYAVTSLRGTNDSAYILKTTNGGDNWSIKFMHDKAFVRIQFINGNTGFTNAFTKIFKTTNAGENWTVINLPSIFGDDMFVLNQDTIWLAMSESLTGGVYRTTNGGASWDRQINLGSSNPDHIYMFNGRIGFISENNNYTRKTTDGGQSWFIITSGSGEGFNDMYFVDSLNGLGSFYNVRKTTNGGLNWVAQVLPFGGNIGTTGIYQFSKISADTIWGVGGIMITTLGQRGMLYRTTNGGTNWSFQVPDTVSININQYSYMNSYDNLISWAYPTVPRGIHTTTGGDPIFYTSVKQISSNTPDGFKLEQNYPNPFNPKTNIKYQIPARSAGGLKSSNVILKVYDVQGREIETLVNQKQNTGIYETIFDGTNYSSGIYFYSLIVDGKLVDTKKMILLK